MIEIVTPQNHQLYRDQLDLMHRMRYRVVIEKWGWEVPTARPGYDIDPFDAEHTVYILHLNDERNEVQGCCRLNPTTKPTMLSELYAEECDLSGPPQDPRIWESSRFVISDTLQSKEEYLEIMWRLGVGINEYCLKFGIDQIAWYTSPPFYNAICSVMQVTPLGRPLYNNADDDFYTPALSNVDEESLQKIRQNLHDPEMELCFVTTPLLSSVDLPRRAA